jgi:AraC-like DNA-binding protein
MSLAIDLLKRGDETSSRIAADCGFHDHYASIKRFRKFIGNTPILTKARSPAFGVDGDRV